MKKLDILIIGIVVLISSLYFLNEFKKIDFDLGKQRVVEVYVNNELILTEQITETTNKKILIKSNKNVYQGYEYLPDNNSLDYKGFDLLYIHDNGIEVIDADCPNRIIVRMGLIRYSNMPLLCLPREIMVVIRGQSNIKDKLPPIIVG